ncbi:MAG: hypothetical protein ACOH5I_00820 [Oligoflexus sp.]
MLGANIRLHLSCYLFGFYLLLTGCLTVQAPYSSIPERQSHAPSGSEFAKTLQNLDPYTRETFIMRELRRGNMPSHLRDMVPVKVSANLKNRGYTEGMIWVTPDYLAIGDDADYIRFPMNPITAQRIADHFGCVLPTRKLVDVIYKQAHVKLAPQPMPPDNDMVRTHRFIEHNQKILAQLPQIKKGSLIAGHKKDIVLTNRIVQRKQTVAIYGWHDSKGQAIQPLSTIHKNYYADYSHGVRLIAGMMLIDGKEYPVAEVLQDRELAPLLSDEGALTYIRYPTEGTLIRKKWTP